MRVLFTAWPTPAHLYPLVPLAWAAQTAGHEVIIASHPSLTGEITSVGLTAAPLGDPDVTPLGPGRPTPDAVAERLDRAVLHLGLSGTERNYWNVFRYFMLPPMWDFHPVDGTPDQPHPVVDDLVELARDWRPDLVLWDPFFVAGGIAARACGAAHGRQMWGLDYYGWAMRRYAERGERGDGHGDRDGNPLLDTVRPAAERHGVEVDENLVLGDFTVDAVPDAMRIPLPTRTVPMRWVPYSGPRTMPSWLYRGGQRPRVALSLGQSRRLVLQTDGWELVPSLIEMVGGLDAEVVATLNEAQLSGVDNLPDNVRVVDYVPLTQLLPTCSALVHHGAPGSFSSAAHFDVPQAIIDSDDYHFVAGLGAEWTRACRQFVSANAARYVADSGAGVALPITRDNVPEMRERLATVLAEPSFAAGAADLGARLRAAPSLNDVVGSLEKLTADARGTRGRPCGPGTRR